MKTLTYLTFIAATAFVLLVLLLKLSVIPIMTVRAPQAAPSRPALIIDPGHGGEDGGAVASDGTLEADLNFVCLAKARDDRRIFRGRRRQDQRRY